MNNFDDFIVEYDKDIPQPVKIYIETILLDIGFKVRPSLRESLAKQDLLQQELFREENVD